MENLDMETVLKEYLDVLVGNQYFPYVVLFIFVIGVIYYVSRVNGSMMRIIRFQVADIWNKKLKENADKSSDEVLDLYATLCIKKVSESIENEKFKFKHKKILLAVLKSYRVKKILINIIKKEYKKLMEAETTG